MTPIRSSNEGVKSLDLQQIAELVGGELLGRPDERITGVAGIKEAQKGDITFLANARYLPFLEQTQASAVITTKDVSSSKTNLIRTDNPSAAFTRIIEHFRPVGSSAAPGVHATAVIGTNVKLGADVAIGPHVVLCDGVCVGDGSIIEANTFVGEGSLIGRESRLYPNVTVRERTEIGDRVIIHSGTVIGGDGFGYESVGGAHLKIPQLGSVRIEDDVEIGANACIDRGRFGKTLIKKGTKIDNLVQIAHNVTVGENSILVSQCGISGSTELGRNVIIAGQAGLVGHIRVGDEAIIGASAGVTKDVPEKAIVIGSPAKPALEQKRIVALISRLPELFKDLAELKKKLNPNG